MKIRPLLPCLFLASSVLHGQSVSIEGDVDPSPAASPVWTIPGNLQVGVTGAGSLTLAGGGAVNVGGTVTLASLAGSSGTLNFGAFDLLSPTTGGTLNASAIVFGGGTGVINFNQTDTVTLGHTISGDGRLVQRGTGTTVLTGATTLTRNDSFAGMTSVKQGTLEVAGAGASLMQTGSSINIGESSGDNGTFTVRNGATVSDSRAYIGRSVGAVGTATVTGADSRWQNGISLAVGYEGDGALTISDGAHVTSAEGYISFATNSTGAVTVTGLGSTWQNSGPFHVGRGGRGTLTIADGGQVLVGGSGAVDLGAFAGGDGSIVVSGSEGARGVLSTARIVTGPGAGKITLDGGILRATADEANFLQDFSAGSVTLGAAGGFIDTNTHSVGIATVLGGTGGLTKEGLGTLTLSGANTYSGVTTVAGGRLIVDGTLASSAVSVRDGATLAPGTGASTLAVNGLTLSDYSHLDFQLGTPGVVGGGVNDLISVNGDLVLGGLLNISALSGFGVGDYRLINYTGTLTNNTLLFGIVEGGYDYAVNTATANQVNLTVSAATAQYWDGAHMSPQGVAGGSGGTGVWSTRNTNWTNAGGNANSNWLGGLDAVFAGTGGTVTLADGYTARVPGLRFQSTGYVIAATGTGALVLTGGGVIDVQTDAATISAPIGGTGPLVKQGGTLTLTGANTYAGGTTVKSGALILEGGSISHSGANLTVGRDAGDNASLVIDGGTISNATATIGRDAGSTGSVTMTTGSWANTGELRVGDSGKGSLTFSGGTISFTGGSGTRILNIARGAGSTGTVTMTGGSFPLVSSLYVGNGGNGSFDMTGGSLSTRAESYVGYEADSTGVMRIGGDANVSFFRAPYVGYRGTGTMEISGNATINVTQIGFRLGSQAGSTGTVTMSGGTVNATANTTIGGEGTGIFTMTDGAVTMGVTIIGNGTGTGKLSMSGGTWTNTISLAIGNAGSGTFQLENGTMNSGVSDIGNSASGVGTATMSGGTWISSGELRVGNQGRGTLALSQGSLSSAVGNIARESGSIGTATVSGGSWTNATLLVIGNSGAGSLTISGTGQVSAPGTEVGRSTGGTGTLTLAGGTLSTGNITEGAGSGTVVFNGGMLKLTANQSVLFDGFEDGDITISTGGAVINTNGFDASTATGLGGPGAFKKKGLGKLNLTGASTYAGPTTVEAGTLIVDGSITSDVTVQSGATFGGTGIVDGDITLETGSTLVAVDCLDADSLTWNPGATLVFSLSDGFSDILELTGDLTKDGAGAFEFTFTDAGWQIGQTYTLILFSDTNFDVSDFTFTNGGGFTGTFALDGNSLEFTLVAVPEPSTLAFAVVGLMGATILLRRKKAVTAL